MDSFFIFHFLKLTKAYIDDSMKVSKRKEYEKEYSMEKENETKASIHDEQEYVEDILADSLEKDFSPSIIQDAEDYYEKGKVLNIYKNNNRYYAKVEGHDNKRYTVIIEVFRNDDADYCCDCDCEYPCKHVYAVLLGISDGEYEEIELKKRIYRSTATIKETLEQIPSEELKNYLLTDDGLLQFSFKTHSFNEFFKKYLPKQSYEYYYNNLYNALVLDDKYDVMIEEYIKSAREYLKISCLEETFKIIKSIIEAGHDSERLDVDDNDFELINKLGMLLRIVYRKAKDIIRDDILEWTNRLQNLNYYNNYYLEDMVLTLK